VLEAFVEIPQLAIRQIRNALDHVQQRDA
jgi:hypothetical protein